jgi:hypothetical protein
MKMYFTLNNGRDSVGCYMCDLRVTVLYGQVWHVGASNIRVNFSFTGSGSLTVQADNPALNANPNISNANGYMAMTTTPVATGTAIGLSILTFISNGFYTLSPGTYRLATLRWIKTPPINSILLQFRVPPTPFATVVYDSTVQLIYNINYTVNEPQEIKTELKPEIPIDYALFQNYPNPFNPITKIKFEIPAGQRYTIGFQNKAIVVQLKVFDITGREITTLVNEQLTPGTYEATFDGSNFSSGIYFYRLKTEDFAETKRMVLLK